jgi:hypothetical protein
MSKVRTGSLVRLGALLAIVGGVLQISAGVASLAGSTTGGIQFVSFTPTLIAALLVTGVSAIAVAIFAMRGARVAWAFALSIHGTLFVVLLLAAPTIASIGVPGPLALAPALLCGAITTVFAFAANEF